ncbi:MAG TPA: DUF6683 family protein, partial [Pyrinomonadaceae bacterium]|nr:DUF6683 family protein [Pyrinomonadaceae bacterium]
MKRKNLKKLIAPIFALLFLIAGITDAQIQSAGGGYYVAGYGTVYGSFGQASVAQSRMYDAVKSQNRRTAERNSLIQKWGLTAVEKAERDAASGSSRSSNPKLVVPPPRIIRNYGVFRPDPTIDSGKALADALGNTPDEKVLIKKIYATTKAAYEKEAAVRGWKNNVAAGLTFFTVAAMTVYHDAEMPSDEAVNSYYKVMNAALDEMPELATAANK